MPLLKGSSPDIIRENYKTLKEEGKPENQAWAIAMRLANKEKSAARVAKKVAAKRPKGMQLKRHN